MYHDPHNDLYLQNAVQRASWGAATVACVVVHAHNQQLGFRDNYQAQMLAPHLAHVVQESPHAGRADEANEEERQVLHRMHKDLVRFGLRPEVRVARG
jgi:hypothetical protein